MVHLLQHIHGSSSHEATGAHPNDLLAYSSMIIKASLDYDDTPWLSYDSHFRRQLGGCGASSSVVST